MGEVAAIEDAVFVGRTVVLARNPHAVEARERSLHKEGDIGDRGEGIHARIVKSRAHHGELQRCGLVVVGSSDKGEVEAFAGLGFV